jgi:NDP-4-keto-2,6-dideoxyhexose 3-C-methyltransferase
VPMEHSTRIDRDVEIYRAISQCRICRAPNFQRIIHLGHQALSGRFPATDESDPPVAPLSVVRCTGCGLVQLAHSVDPGQMFSSSYGYRSGLTHTMRDHLSGISSVLQQRANLRPGDLVLDIGCNDATLLNSYSTDVMRVGIDPLARFFQSYYPASVKIHSGFFNRAAFHKLSGPAKARIVTSIAMFYDLEDPAGFVADVAQVLAPDGIWLLEQSYLPAMLERNSFDTICHEHLEYYALAQIQRLVAAANLRVFDVLLNDINGGSFQLWVCHAAAHYPVNKTSIAALEQREQALALHTDAQFAAFGVRVESIRRRLRDLVINEAASGKRIYAYGASTKGNVLLQYCGLDATLIQAAADKNPIKLGKQTPGTRIPIVAEEEARKDADYFLVLPWSFKTEFLEREAAFRARGGKFIFPLPDLEVV